MKFNIGDKVVWQHGVVKIKSLYDRTHFGNRQCLITDTMTNIDYRVNENELQPYVEEEHKPVGSENVLEEDTTRTHTDFSCKDSGIVDPLGILGKSKINIPPQKLLLKGETIGLDYEKEYYESMSKYARLNELLEKAKAAIKMLSELI
jgi:hypothetical protein